MSKKNNKALIKPKTHVRKQIDHSPLLRGKAADLYAEWNAKLEAEGLRAFDDDYGQTIASLNRRAMKRSNGPNTADFEFYDVFKDYCRYTHYKFTATNGESKINQQQFMEMMVAFVAGYSMQEAYDLVKARSDESMMYSAVHFFKLFQECKAEYLRNFQNFSEYMQYRKYELGEPLSFQAWLTKEGLSKH